MFYYLIEKPLVTVIALCITIILAPVVWYFINKYYAKQNIKALRRKLTLKAVMDSGPSDTQRTRTRTIIKYDYPSIYRRRFMKKLPYNYYGLLIKNFATKPQINYNNLIADFESAIVKLENQISLDHNKLSFSKTQNLYRVFLHILSVHLENLLKSNLCDIVSLEKMQGLLRHFKTLKLNEHIPNFETLNQLLIVKLNCEKLNS